MMGKLHSDAQVHGPTDNNVYCFSEERRGEEEDQEERQVKLTRFTACLQLESKSGWMLLKSMVK